ncbi:MAG: NAD(P)/FAD-dependent oxidoreductase [Myxococcota bacterium]
MDDVDALVIGSGFGGLGAALQLAESGARVVVCERLNYPGGSGGTFTHRGVRYEAGATLAMGLDEGDIFADVIADYGLDVRATRLDPVIEVRDGRRTTALPAHPDGFAGVLRQLGASAFADEVERVTTALRPLLREPDLLPPLGLHNVLTHAGRVPGYLALVPVVGRSLAQRLRHYGLDEPHLRHWIEPLCWISVQTGVDEAEAPFAIAAIDALLRSAHHVEGGMGALAEGLVEAVRRASGTVMLGNRVKRLRREDGRWVAQTRHGDFRAPRVFANVLPHSLPALTEGAVRSDRLARRIEGGWGAAMLYLQVAPTDALPPGAFHLDLVDDPALPYHGGNHVFCSVSAQGEDRGAGDRRTVVVSTHMPANADRSTVETVQRQMAATMEQRAPELWDAHQTRMTASPRTFERFTARVHGYVGGIPRLRGFDSYRELFGGPVAPGFHLVGDSVLLGQSTLSAFVSGARIAGAATGTPVRMRPRAPVAPPWEPAEPSVTGSRAR